MINNLFPVVSFVDGWLAGLLPFTVRLSLWGALAGFLSILIYAKLSPQASIATMKTKTRALRREMMHDDLVFADFMRLSRENLKISLKLLMTVFGPAIVSAIPVVLLAIWIHAYLGYEAPSTPGNLEAVTEDKTIVLQVLNDNEPNEISGKKLRARNQSVSPKMTIKIGNRVVYAGNPLSPPTPVLHKRQWWNVFLDDPVGYIIKDAPVNDIKLNISKKRIIKWMPGWASGWETPFFIFVFLAALGIKLGFRIE